MLQQPDDLDAAFKYAELSVRAGDLEAAVSTLERMLIFAPGLPRLQLELGLLYYRVRAYSTAQTYLQSAISGDNVPEPVRLRVETLLAAISTAENHDQFSAEIRTGIRFQTNANRSPEQRNITLNGVGFLLANNATGEEDFNVYLAGKAHFAKDLESQGDKFEVDLIGYGAKQFSRDELDLVQGEITFGPSFDLGRINIDDANIGIYAIGSGVFLGDDFYNYSFGVGTRIAAQLNPQTSVLVKGEYRRRNFENSPSAPNASGRDGNDYRAAVYGGYVVNPRLKMNGGVQGIITSADQNFLAYEQGDVWFGPTVLFDSPISEKQGVWAATLTFGGTFREYDAPDPVINAAANQSDNELFGKIALEVPLKYDWSFLAEAEYRDVSSNYDTREHDNLSAAFSVIKRF